MSSATRVTTSDEFDARTLARLVLPMAEQVLATATRRAATRLAPEGRVDGAMLEAEQTLAHGLAWLATTVEVLRRTLEWADALQATGRFGDTERLILGVVHGEYLAQIVGGIPMAQTETVRPHDLGLTVDDLAPLGSDACRRLMREGNSQAARLALAERLNDALDTGDPDGFGNHGLDETLGMIRDQFRRFAADHVEPFAHHWHLDDQLIPIEVVEAMADLGTFGLTIPEEQGGAGLGKEAMVVVSETLSRAYIGVGSLGTRSEIAAELIRLGGTDAQKAHWLPRIASGEILPTAVFTEPDVGSDLARLSTRAVLRADAYAVTGNKTWITHAARTDLMTLLVRTDPDEAGYRGLSMLLAEKPRGTDGTPFPADGMSGGEIGVLGYRGMKEYDIAFDGFRVPSSALLGGIEGQGFKQLMATFESARIQTAAREKDSDRRCDIEAGMAKLLAARVAWSCADDALQIHGGNGYALEYPISRVLCDARILNIFEGAAEIQAGVIARGLLTTGRN